MKKQWIPFLLAGVLLATSCSTGPLASSSDDTLDTSSLSSSSSTPVIKTLTFLGEETRSMEIGETLTLTWLSENLTETPSLTSSDTSVASADQEGLVTALAAGEATITISADGLTDTVTLHVTAKPFVEITNLAEFDAGVGYTITTNVLSGNSDEIVTYSSSNEEIATVNEDGVVSCLAEGEVTITANLEEASDSILIHIYPCTDWSLLPNREIEIDGVKGIEVCYDQSQPLDDESITRAIVPPAKDGLPVLRASGEELGDNPFFYTQNLTTITIPETVTSIYNSNFGYTSIERFYIHNKVTQIDGHAFSNNEYLTYLYIPDTVTTLDSNFCSYCPFLTDIRLPKGLGFVPSFASTGITHFTIEEGIEELSRNFYGCTALEEVILPSSLKTIARETFRNCSSLKSISLPDELETLGRFAFTGSGILKIFIPISVTSIEWHAFSQLPEGAEIYCEASSLPEGWDEEFISVNDFGGYDYKIHWGATRSDAE